MKTHPRLLLGALLLLGLSSEAAAQYRFLPPDLYVGRPVTVVLPPATDTLRLTYRPNSSIASTETILTGGRPSITWTPSQPGVVTLATEHGDPHNVSVRFRRVPLSSVVVMVLAGAILFGGALFAFRKLF